MKNSLYYQKEIWKPVKGFEKYYSISSYGRLKSFKKNKSGKILSLVNKTGWYLSYVLQYKNNRKSVKIHRLVAEHFIENSDNKPQVNHKDCNKQNNHFKNLEWVTSKENIKHLMKNNKDFIKSMNNYNSFIKPKKIYQYNLKGELINIFNNSVEANIHTGVCARNILQVANKTEYKPGKTRKQAGGFIWKTEKEL